MHFKESKNLKLGTLTFSLGPDPLCKEKKRITGPQNTLGSLRHQDGDGHENVA